MEIDFERVNVTQNPLKGVNSFQSFWHELRVKFCNKYVHESCLSFTFTNIHNNFCANNEPILCGLSKAKQNKLLLEKQQKKLRKKHTSDECSKFENLNCFTFIMLFHRHFFKYHIESHFVESYNESRLSLIFDFRTERYNKRHFLIFNFIFNKMSFFFAQYYNTIDINDVSLWLKYVNLQVDWNEMAWDRLIFTLLRIFFFGTFICSLIVFIWNVPPKCMTIKLFIWMHGFQNTKEKLCMENKWMRFHRRQTQTLWLKLINTCLSTMLHHLNVVHDFVNCKPKVVHDY